MTQILKALEGYKNLFYDIVGPAATGVAVARVAIDVDYVVPSAARELVGIIPGITAEAPAAAESIIAVGDIIGPDFKQQPCEWIFPVAAGKLGAVDQLETTPMEFWAIHAPLKGGEILNIGVTLQDAIAGNAEAFLTMVYSTKPTGKRKIFGTMSDVVAGAAAAGAIDGDNLTVSNALQMYEIVAVTVCAGVVTTLEELASYCLMKCSVWDDIKSTQFFIAPIHSIVGISGVATIKSIQRLPFDAKFLSKQATVETTITTYDAMTVAPAFVHGFRYYGD